MYVHIIDHNSVHLPLIAKLVTECFPALTTITFAKTHDEHDTFVAKADLVVVSGGRWLLHLNPGTHQRLASQLVEAGKPIFAICLGAEAFADYFGAKVVRMEERVSGVHDITLHDDGLCPDRISRTVPVYEHHHWAIRDLPDTLRALATRPEGVELYKHAELPIWGSQFHPEVRRNGGQGRLVFASALRELGYESRF
jgi:GMP synthase-like glutamine amidotransferase